MLRYITMSQIHITGFPFSDDPGYPMSYPGIFKSIRNLDGRPGKAGFLLRKTGKNGISLTVFTRRRPFFVGFRPVKLSHFLPKDTANRAAVCLRQKFIAHKLLFQAVKGIKNSGFSWFPFFGISGLIIAFPVIQERPILLEDLR